MKTTWQNEVVPMGTGEIAVVFFELQTGKYKRHDWESNFYHYRLRNTIAVGPGQRPYTANYIDEHVAKATATDNGLVYDAEFYKVIEAAENESEAQIEKMVYRGWMDIVERIPTKL